MDGNSPTTYLIAIPALLPLCKKLNIRISAIMAVCCSVITVMNLVPWGGVLNRQSVTLAMDSGPAVARLSAHADFRMVLLRGPGRGDEPHQSAAGRR